MRKIFPITAALSMTFGSNTLEAQDAQEPPMPTAYDILGSEGTMKVSDEATRRAMMKKALEGVEPSKPLRVCAQTSHGPLYCNDKGLPTLYPFLKELIVKPKTMDLAAVSPHLEALMVQIDEHRRAMLASLEYIKKNPDWDKGMTTYEVARLTYHRLTSDPVLVPYMEPEEEKIDCGLTYSPAHGPGHIALDPILECTDMNALTGEQIKKHQQVQVEIKKLRDLGRELLPAYKKAVCKRPNTQRTANCSDVPSALKGESE